ncbi:hypothetical protein [Zestomonas carbonaria]|uniref:Uncharacterized protein n=1 Tax=Zestomonas carbonaria TaxID=2762745 RepID=A0A7U7I839_9GAMM|nr:hypothetical protein [Pseudomonas carbonaria]CAD5106326.1 hypothetical protein PSEWESI4_00586 [Pseudomonas carbonaria]
MCPFCLAALTLGGSGLLAAGGLGACLLGRRRRAANPPAHGSTKHEQQ